MILMEDCKLLLKAKKALVSTHDRVIQKDCMEEVFGKSIEPLSLCGCCFLIVSNEFHLLL